MIKKVIITSLLACSVSISAFSQVSDTTHITSAPIDSIIVTENISIPTAIDVKKKNDKSSSVVANQDTVGLVSDRMEVDKSTQKILKKVEPFKPDPTRAVIYSAIFPGLGQIYNRTYWKLPIVYGGFIGIVYAISWNGRMYSDYTKAYKAIMSDDYIARKDEYAYIFPAGYREPSEWTDSQREQFRTNIRNRRDYNRRNRDLSIIAGVALYALCMIDAYVDAQLYDFDISPNLSFRVEPKIGLDNFSQISYGLQCNVKF